MYSQQNAKEPKRLRLGQIVVTPAALKALEEAYQSPEEFLERHMKGDWGEVSSADWKENDLSVEKGFRILSSYSLSTGKTIWIITEADRSATTILLPEDY